MSSKIELYLQRIGYSGNTGISAETLQNLQRAHLSHVPYENLDLLYRRPGSLEIAELYQKIVLDRRGGYCFELNGLLAWLLRELGFHVTEYFGRWLQGEIPLPPRRHRVLKVKVSGRNFLVDAGMGRVCPLEPLELQVGVTQTREGQDYRIILHENLGFVVQNRIGGEWTNYYSFTEDPHWTVDFLYVHYYCAHHPSSVFNRELKVHLFTPYGRNSIADIPDPETGRKKRIARISQPDSSVKTISVAGAEDLDRILRTHFNLHVPHVKDLPYPEPR